MNQPELALVERIEALELNNAELARRLTEANRSAKSWWAGVLAVAVTALFTPFAARFYVFNPATTDVVARSYSLHDGYGVKRASFFMSQEQFPVLAFYNSEGTKVINLAAADDGSAGLFIFDKDVKHERLSLSRSRGEAGLRLYDAKGEQTQATLTNDKLGNVNLKLSDSQGRTRVSAGVWPSGLYGVETRNDRDKATFATPQ